MITIDGSKGEGGGQIIRSSLALSAYTGIPFEIEHVRGKRRKPGLLHQHLTAVHAAREICGGGVTGAELHSSHLTFAPGNIQTREFNFRIGTAGSATLVAQTVLPALMMAKRPSRICVEGGTHNKAAPPFDFLECVYLPLVSRLGPKFTSRIESYGFFPVGGGRVVIDVEPTEKLAPLELVKRGGKTIPQVTSMVSRLPASIGQRECDVIRRKTGWNQNRFSVREIENSPGPGNVVMIQLQSPNVCELFTGFGERGVKAEDVARGVYRQAKNYLSNSAPVGEFLADQLLLPLGLAASQGQTSVFRTDTLSMHSQTHIDVLQLFLDIEVSVDELPEEAGYEIKIRPAS